VQGGALFGTFAATIRWRLSVEIISNAAVRALVQRVFRCGRPARVGDENLPFTAEEFARLIGSGRSGDMRILARGLAQKSTRRASSENASIQ
jgi:hypothetical protein